MSTTDFFFLDNTKVFEGGVCDLALCFPSVDGRAGLDSVPSQGLGGVQGPSWGALAYFCGVNAPSTANFRLTL